MDDVTVTAEAGSPCGSHRHIQGRGGLELPFNWKIRRMTSRQQTFHLSMIPPQLFEDGMKHVE